MGGIGTSKKTRVSGSSSNVDERDVIVTLYLCKWLFHLTFQQKIQIMLLPRRRTHLKRLVPLKIIRL
ncbi:unnamed protein product [Lathyrus oleraceus]